MEWFKIVLIVLLGINVLGGLIRSRKGKYTYETQAWENPTAAVVYLLLLMGVLIYL